jgi:signal transduction histidine kinase
VNIDELVTRLSQHRTLNEAPRAELVWLAGHGSLRTVAAGDVITKKTEAAENMVVLLAGHTAIYVDRGMGPRKVMEWGTGDITGSLPYSRVGKPPGDMVVDEPGELFLVHRSHFAEMIRECPTVVSIVVHLMLDRARRFTASDLQDEKMMSLGRMSAGLAHELNNPASAAARSAHLFAAALADLERRSRDLGACAMSDRQVAELDRWRQTCMSGMPSLLSPVERADREEELTDWLSSHDVDSEVAVALLDTKLTVSDLDSMASVLNGGTLATALRWLAADCATRALATEMQRAATRIHDLVAAMKRLTYMDRTSAPEPTEIGPSLSDTVLILLHKARRKSVSIATNIAADLPRVQVIGGDLNQIWMNLIDNAIDAVPESGHVEIAAERRLNRVIVSVIDDGPGVPPEIRERIFEPLFTTKPVGQGTGLGLDLARRLARRNDGDIEVESRPGRTAFRVALPVAATT